MCKNILLIGGMNKAKSLALSLVKKGYHITIINKDFAACEKLAELDGVKVIYGDGSKAFVLEEANAYTMDLAIALCGNDADNLVVCQLCKKKFLIPKTVSILSDPKKISFFYKMGIDSVICDIYNVTNIIEQRAFMEHMTQVVSLGFGQVEILEIPILGKDYAANKKIWELNFPKNMLIAAIIRGEQTIIPGGDTVIYGGDILIMVVEKTQKKRAICELKAGV